MKKIYVLALAMIFASASFAQLAVPTVKNAVLRNTKTVPYSIMHSSAKATIDTAGWTTGYQPEFLAPTVEIHTYMMTEGTPAVRIGYWFGTNGTTTSDTAADYWAQCWVNVNSIKVSGILFWLSGKANLSSSSASTLSVYLQNMRPYVAGAHGCIIGSSPTTFGPSPAGPVLGSGSLTIANLDTVFTNFNWVPFGSLATVTGDFAAVANFKAIRTHSDTAYMFCDAIGNGLGMDFSQQCVDTAGYYYVSNKLSTLDVNMSIFAVIDDGAGVEDNGSFQGMQMTVRNGGNNVFVDYALQNNSPVEIHVLDMSGNEVAVINEGTKSANTIYTANIDVTKFAKGMYFIQLASKNGRLTKKMIIE
ncbi:MAG: T9SS type A sorting domain-containing protein [Bacteroidota bacterium]